MISSSGCLAIASYIIHTGWYIKSGQGFLPVFDGIGNLARQPIPVHDCRLAIDLTPVPDWHAPPLRGFKCDQIQGFYQRLSTWENALLTVQFAGGSIETLNCVGCIDSRLEVDSSILRSAAESCPSRRI